MSCKPRHINKFLSLLGVSSGGILAFGTICTYRGDEGFYSNLLMPMVSKFIDPEIAHEACILLTRFKLIRCKESISQEQASKLRTNVFNLSFTNPIGLAAGFDKNSAAVAGLKHYGLGFAEVGTVTPNPQSGNPKKRIFRVKEDSALVNRCGFNNKGIDHVVNNLSSQETLQPMLVGLNLGKNKDTQHISSDYLIGLEKSRNLSSVDYFVINISSPNTPGLRDSQEKENLERLLDDVLSKMEAISIKKPLLVKLAPDLKDWQLKDVADVISRKKCGNTKVCGVILTNTTITRPEGTSHDVYLESGGLSGQPLRKMSTDMISDFYKLTKGQVPIIGVGGVSSGEDAYEKIRAGASLVQLYTGLTYEGPPVINKIKRELVELIERDKLNSISDAVGLNHKYDTN